MKNVALFARSAEFSAGLALFFFGILFACGRVVPADALTCVTGGVLLVIIGVFALFKGVLGLTEAIWEG